MMVNTRLDDRSRKSDLDSADHGGPALERVGLAADGFRIGDAHLFEALAGILEERDDHFLKSLSRHGPAQAVEDGGIDKLWIGRR